MNKEYIRALSI